MYPSGISKNGGEASEFILPSGAVLVGGFLPSIGYSESIGVDDENRYDAKEYPDDFYEGMTASGFGNNTAFSASVTIHIPEEYTANSVGELVDETVTDGIRTAVWKSDYPVEWLNVICGKWKVKRGNGTALFYHPAHEYNVDEIVEALDAAREHYSEWFFPFPWKELKVSEFAAHASYAQGLPTNITFSEGIGFLAKSDPRTRVAFFVTAHEAAHQWWGNLLVPGKGPGGNILSEGMAHFSTILLLEEERGLRERIEFCRRIESTYGWQRRVNSEKPMVKTIGSRSGDGTVTYDKGGWVFWMLLNHMGRDNALAGLQAFIRKYHHNPDHPVLQDFVQTMREFAPDRDAYDAFTRQWFFEVVVPEYNLIDPKQTDLGDGKWEVTVEVKNKGTGRMPVEVCASKGKRFPDEDQPEKDDGKSSKDEEYQDARVVLDLVAGESKTATIRCNFKPARVLVDPDALVLQLRREEAQKEL